MNFLFTVFLMAEIVGGEVIGGDYNAVTGPVAADSDWGTSFEAASLAITKPFDSNPATVGNGVMVALQVDSKEAVQALHATALGLGAQDEGAPGPRGDSFYAGYFRDLDGNKLNAFFLG